MSESEVKLISALEFKTGLPPAQVHKLLGLGYSTYSQYRNASRPLPEYVERCIEALLLLKMADLNALMKKHVYGVANG